MIDGALNTAIPLQAVLGDGRNDLYLRALVLNNDGSSVTTIPLPSVGNGMYTGTWTPSSPGYFAVIYQVFSDAGFTTPVITDYPNGSDLISVSTDRENLARILALNHENCVFDQQTYDAGNRLLSGRLRGYDSKANADAAGSTGLLYQWTVTATYDGSNRPNLFKIGRTL